MSPVRMLLPIVFALVRCLVALADGSFQVQPQPVRINNQEEIYITEEDNYIGQVLYRFDQLQLECECQMHADQSHYHLYWTVNNQLVHAHNDSKRMQLAVDRHTVQEPITYVTCHCLFNQANSKEIVRDYRYKLYIDLASEPSLQPIEYSVQPSMVKGHVDDFLRRHVTIVLTLMFVAVLTTCALLILNWRSFH